MKQELFFHHRAGGDDSILDHTYCVKAVDNRLLVGYSIVHENDQFCRKTGRERAKDKVKSITSIPVGYFKKLGSEDSITINQRGCNCKKTINFVANLPESVDTTIGRIVQKSGEILGIVGRTKVCTLIQVTPKLKVPVVKEFEIKPVTPTQVSDDLFHSKI